MRLDPRRCAPLGRLGELIDVVATIELTASEGEKTHRSGDLLGRVYEYFLTRLALMLLSSRDTSRELAGARRGARGPPRYYRQSVPPHPEHSTRLADALRLVVRRYAAQVVRRPGMAIPALLLPGIGNAFIFYAPPLVVARLLGEFSQPTPPPAAALMPYVLTLAGLWITGEAIWRLSAFLLARTEIRAMEALYIEAVEELLAKDLSFFHDNIAGAHSPARAW